VLKRSRSDSEAESSDGERPADLNLSRLDDSDEFGYTEQNASETLSTQEVQFRSEANDYECRYCGHCNTTTDIKEANFFGRYTKLLYCTVNILLTINMYLHVRMRSI